MLNLKQYIVSSCSTHIKNIYRTTITVCVNFRLESVIVRQAAKIDILIPGTFNLNSAKNYNEANDFRLNLP